MTAPISIIVPYYYKYDLFEITLKYNYRYFSLENREVILMLDNNDETQKVLDLVWVYDKIKWKIFVNENPQRYEIGWRNPSIVINTAISKAKQGMVFVISPESLMKSDVIGQLSDVAIKHNDFACGFVNFCELKDDNTLIEGEKWLPYGSVVFHSSMAYFVGGYDVRFKTFGGDDDQIRRKFQKFLGCKGYYLPSAKIYHLEKGVRPHKQASQENLNLLNDLVLNKEIVVDENFEIVYDTTK